MHDLEIISALKGYSDVVYSLNTCVERYCSKDYGIIFIFVMIALVAIRQYLPLSGRA